MGGKFHLKLNTGNRPIANKYREGKMKRTLKRELKGLEIAKREPLGRSGGGCGYCLGGRKGGQVSSAPCRSAWVTVAGNAGDGKVNRSWCSIRGACCYSPSRLPRAGCLTEVGQSPVITSSSLGQVKTRHWGGTER